MVVRALVPAFALLAVAVLAGCSSSGGGSVIQIAEHVTAATGPRTASGECDGTALVQASGSGTSGSFRMRVTDGSGKQVYDSGSMAGNGASQSLDVKGAEGTWTVIVDRMAYSGSYSAQVVC
jgi:hypothetical protein